MPLGLTMNTRPLDCSVPRIVDGLCVTTRFNTALDADCWTKRVISFAPIEKLCQLRMAFGVLVICSRLPFWTIVALPLTTLGPVGFANAAPARKLAATATEMNLGFTRNPSRGVRHRTCTAQDGYLFLSWTRSAPSRGLQTIYRRPAITPGVRNIIERNRDKSHDCSNPGRHLPATPGHAPAC